MPGEQIALLLRGVILAVAACLSAFFSGSETALFSLPLEEVRRMERSHGVDRHVATLLSRPKRLLTTILFCNMVVNVTFFSVSFLLIVQHEAQLRATGSTALGFASFLTIIIFGEVVPKNIAVAFSRPVSRLAAVPLLVLQRVLFPFLWTLEKVTDNVSALFERRLRPEPLLDAEELQMLVDMSREEGALDHDIGEMLLGVMQLSRMPVRQVMVPRVEMDRFDLDDPPEQLTKLFTSEKHAQIPVYKTQSENMLGVIHAKDFLLRGQDTSLRDLIRPIPFIPETATVEDALRKFRQEHVKMAFVVDEYGTVLGLVTVEDITEEIVGEIGDEYDEEPVPDVERIDQRRHRVRGDLSVREWHDMFEMDMPELSVDTIGGLVMTLLERVPRTGDTVRYGNLELTVEKMRGPRVVSVVLQLVGSGQAETGTRRGSGA